MDNVSLEERLAQAGRELREELSQGKSIILRDGSKVLLHMSLGNKESQESWLEHFRSLVSRGLPTPLTVTSDGAPGLIKAIEAMWPESERIRCSLSQDGQCLGQGAR